jgi:hypothetical protein
MDLLYGLLKVSSLIATGLFGALGLLTKYRDAEGKITKWGKVALGGILISSFTSLSLFILETSRAKAKALDDKAKAAATAQKLETILVNAETTAEQQKKSLAETNVLKLGLGETLKRSDYIAEGMENSLAAQQAVLSGNRRILGGVTSSVQKQADLLKLNTSTLNEVSRGLYPIKDVRIGYWIRVPMDHVQLRSYLARFNSVLTPLLPLAFGSGIPWITGGAGGMDGKTYEQFGFSAAAPMAPDRTTEKLAYTLLGYSEVSLQFFKKPIAPNDHPLISGNWQSDIKADLKLGVSSDFFGRESGTPHSIEYELESRQFKIRSFGLSSDPRYWEGTGKIVGLPDLIGAQMFVDLRSVMVSGDPTVDQYLKEIRKGLELQTLIVSLSSGSEFWFRTENLQKHTDKEGYPIYSFVFPKTMEELRKLER